MAIMAMTTSNSIKVNTLLWSRMCYRLSAKQAVIYCVRVKTKLFFIAIPWDAIIHSVPVPMPMPELPAILSWSKQSMGIPRHDERREPASVPLHRLVALPIFLTTKDMKSMILHTLHGAIFLRRLPPFEPVTNVSCSDTQILKNGFIRGSERRGCPVRRSAGADAPEVPLPRPTGPGTRVLEWHSRSSSRPARRPNCP